jgi:hypothetical protein
LKLPMKVEVAVFAARLSVIRMRLRPGDSPHYQ